LEAQVVYKLLTQPKEVRRNLNTTVRVTVIAFAVLAICSISLPLLADAIPVSSPAGPQWKPQEQRQEYVVSTVVFSAKPTAVLEDGGYSFMQTVPDTLALDLNSRNFVQQMHSLYPGYEFGVVGTVDKIGSNQEPCTFTFGPEPGDPTMNTLSAEFRLSAREGGAVTTMLNLKHYRIDPDNPTVSPDGKMILPREQTQGLFTQRIIEPGHVIFAGGFGSDQDGVVCFAIAISPHNPQPQTR